ncbi:hypothetical protein Syun_025183 [Stephania yunnanensis]|uniref:Serine-threonine/tyrosine-protein kinase catalytic domain-containing protein n=1 Tax=Stephania yunnanensis TaxID=152371 RepID=A0AAP0EYA4_9MAGN
MRGGVRRTLEVGLWFTPSNKSHLECILANNHEFITREVTQFMLANNPESYTSCVVQDSGEIPITLESLVTPLAQKQCPKTEISLNSVIEFSSKICPQDTTGCSFEPKITKFKSLPNQLEALVQTNVSVQNNIFNKLEATVQTNVSIQNNIFNGHTYSQQIALNLRQSVQTNVSFKTIYSTSHLFSTVALEKPKATASYEERQRSDFCNAASESARRASRAARRGEVRRGELGSHRQPQKRAGARKGEGERAAQRRALMKGPQRRASISAMEALKAERGHKRAMAGLEEYETSYISVNCNCQVINTSPEYACTGMLNEKSDIYSFGILIMEIISSENPVDHFMDSLFDA